MSEITEKDGKVAIRHYNSNPAQVVVGGTAYFFEPRLSISLCWVKKEDVPEMLTIKAGLCCGKSADKFHLANDLDVCLWETGQRC